MFSKSKKPCTVLIEPTWVSLDDLLYAVNKALGLKINRDIMYNNSKSCVQFVVCEYQSKALIKQLTKKKIPYMCKGLPNIDMEKANQHYDDHVYMRWTFMDYILDRLHMQHYSFICVSKEAFSKLKIKDLHRETARVEELYKIIK